MTYNSLRREVFEGLDVEEGFRIPVANEKNKRLEDKYLELQRCLATLNSKLNEQSNRFSNMNNHYKNVKAEVESCKNLLAAKEKELETEQHLSQVQQRELENFRHNTIKLTKQLADVKEQKHTFQNAIFVASERLEAKRQEAELNKEQLEELLEECRIKNEDEMVLEKYSRQDETKIADLTVKISSVTQECLKQRRKMEQQAVELKSARYGLEKTAEEYRAGHRERQMLIERWAKTLSQMQLSDVEIDELSIKVTMARRQIEEAEQRTKEEMDRLEREKASNEWAESKIRYLEGVQARMKQTLMEMEAVRETLKSERKGLRNVLNKTASQLEGKRAEVKQLKKEVTLKKERIGAAKELVKELKMQLKEQEKGKMGSEEKAKQLEAKLNAEEKSQKRMEEESRLLGEAIVRKHKSIKELKEQAKQVEVLINGGKSSFNNMGAQLRQLEQEALRQRKIIYNHDYTLQALSKKLDTMAGKNVMSEEKEKCEKEIKEMEALLAGRKKKLQGMKTQQSLLTEEVKRQKVELERLREVSGGFERQVAELELKLELTMKALKAVVSVKEEKLLEENLKKLEVKRLQSRLMRQLDEELGRERELAMLAAVVQEREAEIDAVTKQVVSRSRLVEEDLRKSTNLLQDSLNKENCLKNKYEVVMMKMTRSNEGQEESLVSYAVKSAYETEELKARGDQLEQEMRATEAELQALENTMALVEGSNQAQRGVLRKATCSISDAEKMEYNGRLKRVAVEVKELKRQATVCHARNKELVLSLNDFLNKRSYLDQAVQERNIMLSKLDKEVHEQKLKLSRIQKMNAKLIKETEKLRSMNPGLNDELRLKELRLVNRMVDGEIVNTFNRMPHLVSTLQQEFNQAGISLSAHFGTTPSHKSLSRSSSLLSLRSSTNSPSKLTRATSRISTVLISLDNDAVSNGSRNTGIHSRKEHSRQNSGRTLSRTLSRSTLKSTSSMSKRSERVLA